MGRSAIISDVHGNLEALTAVLDHIRSQGISEIYSLGDIVGYNANPKECLALVRDREIRSIQGNHDRYVRGTDVPRLRETVLQSIEFARQQLSEEELRFLGTLPETWRLDHPCLLVHGSPFDKDEYIFTDDDVRDNLDFLRLMRKDIKLCFCGHTHTPMVACLDWVRRDFQESKTVQLDRDRTYLINPGSVGQPRDLCPLSSYLVFDPDAWSISFWRLDYDRTTAQQKILDCGLAPVFAARLSEGK